MGAGMQHRLKTCATRCPERLEHVRLARDPRRTGIVAASRAVGELLWPERLPDPRRFQPAELDRQAATVEKQPCGILGDSFEPHHMRHLDEHLGWETSTATSRYAGDP